jgi:DNA-binding NarL/FixJ family response regulator
MPSLVLIDDHPLFRAGLKSALALQPSLSVLGEAADFASGREAVERASPEVVVLDLIIPGGGGLALGRTLIADRPQTRILMLSATSDTNTVDEALHAGIAGYASKTQSIDEIVEAILEVAAGRSYLAPAFALEAERIPEASSPELGSLTARERQVFGLTVDGLSSIEIGNRLSISRRTVETHRARILRKLHVRGAVGMVRLAAQWGLLPPNSVESRPEPIG